MSSKNIHNLIILDESGSMDAIKQPTIAGFNEVVQTIKKAKEKFPEQEHLISLFTFNSDGVKRKLYVKPVAELEEINENIYQPNCSTPLFDAIGVSVSQLKYYLQEEKDVSVLVTILTDGAENASTEYSGSQVKQLIEELKGKGWTFTYIGANHDVEAVATSISITNSLQFHATKHGVLGAIRTDSMSRMAYMKRLARNENVQTNYFEQEDKDGEKEVS